MTKYYAIHTIGPATFKIDFDEEQFNRSKSLCGKYVICTNVKVEQLDREQVRGKYRNLQHVEHAFRDLKSDNISRWCSPKYADSNKSKIDVKKAGLKSLK
jgi:uncharacterized protein (DUF2237 family)